MTSSFQQTLRTAGILGAGGGGFPAFAKYGRAEVVLVNGVECEPLVRKDWWVLMRGAADVTTALGAIREETGAKEVALAVKERHAAALREVWGGGKILPVKDVYPAGDESLLIYDVLGRRVPAAGVPNDVGVIVSNVETVYHVGRALRGKVVTKTWITVAGAVEAPYTAEVPVGTLASELIAAAGGAAPGSVVFAGGPMMGEEIDPATYGVRVTTSALVVLPSLNSAVRHRRLPLAHIKKIAASACTQCRQCTDLCPRYLMGYDVTPHLSMRRFAGWREGEDAGPFANAAGCTACGLCELYVCPMGLSPRRVQQRFAATLPRAARRDGAAGVHPDRAGRLVPAERLRRRLGLGGGEAPFRGLSGGPVSVIMSTRQPYAKELEPQVAEGDIVEEGQIVAAPRAGDARGVPVYASIPGRVARVTTDGIAIDRNRAAGR